MLASPFLLTSTFVVQWKTPYVCTCIYMLLASEQSERAQSYSCSIEISDTYAYIYIYIYKLYHITSHLMHAIGPKVWIK